MQLQKKKEKRRWDVPDSSYVFPAFISSYLGPTVWVLG